MVEIIIHAVGITSCTSAVVIKVVNLYRESKELAENKYDEDDPYYKYLSASIFGLGLNMAAVGWMVVEEMAGKLFNSGLMDWVRGTIKPLQVQPDGIYFDFKFGEWAGHDDAPKEKLGKYEMDI